jgi:hypothetical protein
MGEINYEAVGQTLANIGTANRQLGVGHVLAGGGAGESPIQFNIAASAARRHLDGARNGERPKGYDRGAYWDFVAALVQMQAWHQGSAESNQVLAERDNSDLFNMFAGNDAATVIDLGQVLEVVRS